MSFIRDSYDVRDLYDTYKQKDTVEMTLHGLYATNLDCLLHRQSLTTIELSGVGFSDEQISIVIDALIDYIQRHSSEIKEEIMEKLSLDLKQKIVDTKPIIEELLQQTIDIENELNKTSQL